MKRLLSAAFAATLALGAVAPAFASDITNAARPVKLTASHMTSHHKAAAHASQFAAVPGKKHFGMAIMTKAQAGHHFAVSRIANLQGQAKAKP